DGEPAGGSTAEWAGEPGRCDLHVHTSASDGRDSPEDMVRAARSHGLDLIAIADHDTLAGALRARDYSAGRDLPEVIVGCEVSSRDGHVLGLFLQSPVAAGMSAAATVASIHAQGGLAIASHAFWQTRPSRRNPIPLGVGRLITELAFDAVEVSNGAPVPTMWLANRRVKQLNRRLGLAEVGGSDAHARAALGWAYTLFPGRTAAELREGILSGRCRPGRSLYRPWAAVGYLAGGVIRDPSLLT